MKIKDLQLVYECVEALAKTCATMHKHLNYTKEYSYEEDELWKLRVYLCRLAEKLENELPF